MPEKSKSIDVIDEGRSALQAGAKDVRTLAAALDRKLKVVEEWLGKLEGRVSTGIVVADPEKDGWDFGLRLQGPPWRLECRHINSNSMRSFLIRADSDWQPVLNSSLSSKMLAAAAIPALFGKMAAAQMQFIQRLQAANQKIDDFATEVGIADKEDA